MTQSIRIEEPLSQLRTICESVNFSEAVRAMGLVRIIYLLSKTVIFQISITDDLAATLPAIITKETLSRVVTTSIQISTQI